MDLLAENAVNGKTSRVLYFDILNISACISVLFLHCNVMVHTWTPGKNWILALIIETLFFFAVPIFFMLTGATLMAYRERYDTATFFRKRVSRIALPFLVWAIIVFGIHNILSGKWQDINAWNPIRFIVGTLNNEFEAIYWFFFPLFAIYLALPVLSLLKNQRKILVYAASVAFFLEYCLPVIFKMCGINWNSSFNMPVLGGFLFYPVLGYLLATTNFLRRERIMLYFVAVICVCLKIGYTLYFSAILQDVERTFFDYKIFATAIPAAAIFVWCKNADFSCLAKYQKIIAKISACSFGIYLIHNLILSGFIFRFLGIPTTSLTLRTIGPIGLYLCCMCIVLILKKIPVLRKIVP